MKALIPALRESHIEKAVSDLLQLDGWRVFHMEQQFSEKKRKTVGEENMPDLLCLRYWAGKVRRKPLPCDQRVNAGHLASGNDVMWIEMKRITQRGRTTTATAGQAIWHRDERLRGALTLIAGVDFEASVDGFIAWYKGSGLMGQWAA